MISSIESKYDAILKTCNTLGFLMDKADIAYISVNASLCVNEWNKAAKRIFGYTKMQAEGSHLLELIPLKEDDPATPDHFSKLYQFQSLTINRCCHLNKDKNSIYCDWHIIKDVNSEGFISGFSMLAYPARPENHSNQTEFDSEKLYKKLIELAPIGVLISDTSGKPLQANHELAWMLGYESPDLLIEQINDLASELFHDLNISEEFFFTLFESEQVNRLRALLNRKDGSTCWVSTFGRVLFDASNRIKGFYCMFIDIRETVNAEERLIKANQDLETISTLDGLTKIANRRKFDTKLNQEWRRLFREQKPISLILSDIDFFKRYNDTYGHQAGDECLLAVAQAIKKSAKRPADLAARYGGEEFAVILPNTDLKGATHLAELIRLAVAHLKILHSGSLIEDHVTLSLGIASTVPGKIESPEILVRQADSALYKAKGDGRNRWAVFNA